MYGGQVKKGTRFFRVPAIMVAGVLLVCSCVSSSHTGTEIASANLRFPERPPELRLFDYTGFRDPATWGLLNGHDPSVIWDPETGFWYAYSTDVQRGMLAESGIQIRRSSDLVSWEFIGRALDGIPDDVDDWASPAGFWAPACIRVNGEYRLYYSASMFGKQRSAIALAVSANPEGPFVHRGIVLKTDTGDPVNAIDPAIVIDNETGAHWMVYGSFWDGIRMLPLDTETGFLLSGQVGDTFGIPVVTRSRAVDGAVEGADIVFNSGTGYYYLFVSYGSLFSDYHIRVARSKTLTGPYRDRNGRVMTDTTSPDNPAGLKITSGFKFGTTPGWFAPGHSAAFNDGESWYLAHHARPEDGTSWPYLQIRRMFWTPDGWPIVNPLSYSGETEQPVSPVDVAGAYDIILFEDNPESTITGSTVLEMKVSGKFTLLTKDSGEKIRGTWGLSGSNTIRFAAAEWSAECVVIPSWDRTADSAAMVLTGLDSRGRCVWACSLRQAL